jgi:hypothetical protein
MRFHILLKHLVKFDEEIAALVFVHSCTVNGGEDIIDSVTLRSIASPIAWGGVVTVSERKSKEVDMGGAFKTGGEEEVPVFVLAVTLILRRHHGR